MLDDIIWEYLYMKSEEGLAYAQIQLELATKLKWMRGIAIANSTLGSQYDGKSDYIKSVNII
jgi:hypothetical protein